MKARTSPREFDELGQLNRHGSHRNPVRRCPICGRRPRVMTGGVGWKWLALHLMRHIRQWSDKR